METSIRVGMNLFYATDEFSRGLARSSYFNKRESEELVQYGATFNGLHLGLLTPINEEEQQFILDINCSEESQLYPVKLWQKYLNAVQKNKTFHGFSANHKFSEKENNQQNFNRL